MEAMSATITVQAEGEDYRVTVAAGAETQHLVTVDPDFHEELTGGKVSVEQLVEDSFRFLLDREPNTSILRRFDLRVIGHYFPEYQKTMRHQYGV